jgi:hypothetical protein
MGVREGTDALHRAFATVFPWVPLPATPPEDRRDWRGRSSAAHADGLPAKTKRVSAVMGARLIAFELNSGTWQEIENRRLAYWEKKFSQRRKKIFSLIRWIFYIGGCSTMRMFNKIKPTKARIRTCLLQQESPYVLPLHHCSYKVFWTWADLYSRISHLINPNVSPPPRDVDGLAVIALDTSIYAAPRSRRLCSAHTYASATRELPTRHGIGYSSPGERFVKTTRI